MSFNRFYELFMVMNENALYNMFCGSTQYYDFTWNALYSSQSPHALLTPGEIWIKTTCAKMTLNFVWDFWESDFLHSYHAIA